MSQMSISTQNISQNTISKNSNVIIFCRISTPNQIEGSSLSVQERICRDAVSSNLVQMVINIVGSGYNLNTATKSKYDMICKFKNPVVVCLSVDRFSRNVEYGTSIYQKIKRAGGKMIFVMDNIDTSVDEKAFYAKLELAQKESEIKSNKMKLTSRFTTNAKIQACNTLDGLYSFITKVVQGESVNDIYASFLPLVDWNNHPDWEGCKKSPIDFLGNTYFNDNGEECVIPNKISLKDIATILNMYEIPVQIQGVRNKKWNDKLVEAVLNRNNLEYMLQFLNF